MNSVPPPAFGREGLAGLLAGGGVVGQPLVPGRAGRCRPRRSPGSCAAGRRRARRSSRRRSPATARPARQHVLPRAVQRHAARGAAGLDVDHRHALGEQPLAHQRREADLAADVALAPAAHAAVAEPGVARCGSPSARPASAQRGQVGLARQVLEARVGPLAEAGAAGADDVGVLHRLYPSWIGQAATRRASPARRSIGLAGLGALDPAEALHQAADAQLAFEPRQRRAHAEMQAEAEGQVPVRRARRCPGPAGR